MTDQELRKLQLVQLDLIMEVDRICKKCGIIYNMVGGTMLGAVRHGGYIPWDDDADIGFLREEYEKFRKACRTELGSRYYFQDFRDTPGYRWGYGKLRRKDTEFIRLQQEFMPYEQGIAIDLMPFDNVPDGWLHKRIHKSICFIYRKIFWSAVGRKSDAKKWKRILYGILYRLPEEKLFDRYERFIGKNAGLKTRQVRILTFPTPKGVYGYDRRWYEELTEYEFEGHKLPGAADYDSYLTVKYGDYMKLPSTKSKKTHPVSKLTLPVSSDQENAIGANMKKYKTGYTDGVFDLFHVGHLNMINTAKSQCEYLIVGVHGDDVVEQYKKCRPIINEKDRRRIIASVKGVDRAEINRFRDKMKLWELYHFDVIFIGDDWKGTERWIRFEEQLKEINVDVVYVPYTKGISTTEIRTKIMEF